MNAIGGEICGDRGVEKFCPVVGLHGNERAQKLRTDVSDEVNNSLSSLGFLVKGKSPHEMREIIDNNKIVFETRITQKW